MLANPDKFQAMTLQRHLRSPTDTNEFHIRNTDIIPEPMVKLVGVLLNNKLCSFE